MRCKFIAAAIGAVLGVTSLGAHAATGDTNLSGKMYFDFTHIDQHNSDTGNTNNTGTGLDVKRFYLSVTHDFDSIWSANLTTDFNYVSSDGQTNLFVKKAYVQGKFSKALVFRVGSADMPWIPFVEHQYGFRYVENTLIDRLHFGNSADWGLHLGGKLGQDGAVSYSTAIVNGGGYKHPGRSNAVDFEGRAAFSPMPGLVLALGAYSGKRGEDKQNINAPHTASRGDALVAYSSKGFRIGGEYFSAQNWNNVLTAATDKADGFSVWASAPISDSMEVFARYDRTKLSKNIDPSAKDTYFNAGVQFKVNKSFELAVAYKHGNVDGSVSSPMPIHVANTRTSEIGVWGQVAF